MSSSAPFDSSFEAFREQSNSRQGFRLTERFCDVSQFLFRMRVQLRFGRLSRAPLKMLRLEIKPEIVECDFLSRAGDPWDVDLPKRLAEKHLTLQVFRDAIDLRSVLFFSLPNVETARLRIYREAEPGVRELIMVGDVHRNDHSARWVHSLAMRARVLGFRFQLVEDTLKSMKDDNCPIYPQRELEF